MRRRRGMDEQPPCRRKAQQQRRCRACEVSSDLPNVNWKLLPGLWRDLDYRYPLPLLLLRLVLQIIKPVDGLKRSNNKTTGEHRREIACTHGRRFADLDEMSDEAERAVHKPQMTGAPCPTRPAVAP